MGDRFKIGLLWKHDSKLDNNYSVDKAQFDSLQRRLNNGIELEKFYLKTLDTDLNRALFQISFFLKYNTREIMVHSPSQRHLSH